jgi:hypothetical protein
VLGGCYSGCALWGEYRRFLLYLSVLAAKMTLWRSRR